MVKSKQILVPSDGFFNIINLTSQAREFIKESTCRNGQLSVFIQHTTSAIIITEHEAGIMADMQELFEKITPTDHDYKHNIRKVDFNCHAHLRAIIMQPGISVPVIEGEIALGLHQEILLIDDQIEEKPRSVIFQFIGD